MDVQHRHNRGEECPFAGRASSHSGRRRHLGQVLLKFLMWVVFLSWATWIFLYPTKPVQAAFGEWAALTKHSIFGVTGTVFLVFSAPILIVAALAYVYICAFPPDHVE